MSSDLVRIRLDVPTLLLDEVIGQVFLAGAQGVEVCDQETDPLVPDGRVWIHAWHDGGKGIEVAARYRAAMPEEVTVTMAQEVLPWREQLARHEHLEIGRGFTVGDRPGPASGRRHIWLEPGLGFGNGEHPTTRCCVAAMEDLWVDGPPPESVADIGTGSGILSLVAAHLGAQVWATDIEDIALKAAARNSEANGLAHRICVVDAIPPAQEFELVVANLYLGPLISMSESLYAWTRRDGWCIVSGITLDGADEIIRHFECHGFSHRRVHRDENWVALSFKRIEK